MLKNNIPKYEYNKRKPATRVVNTMININNPNNVRNST